MGTFAALLAACANVPEVPLADGVAELNHDFILGNDDAELRTGANPMYVLLDYHHGQKQYRLLAISKRPISFTRRNQELLYVTQNFTNVVPAWTDYYAHYDKDASTGTRSNYRFTSKLEGRGNYSPERSRFSSRPMRNNDWADYLTLSQNELRKAISQTNLLFEARRWSAGSKTFPDSGPVLQPMTMPAVMLAIVPHSGEKDRFYFEPERAITSDGEFVEVGSSLYFERVEGIATTKRSSFDSLKRARISRVDAPDRRGGFGGNHGCIWAFMDVEEQLNKEHRFCGNSYRSVAWNRPLWAETPVLGKVQVAELRGKRYTKDGKLTGAWQVSMGFNEFEEYRLLSSAEAASVHATSR